MIVLAFENYSLFDSLILLITASVLAVAVLGIMIFGTKFMSFIIKKIEKHDKEKHPEKYIDEEEMVQNEPEQTGSAVSIDDIKDDDMMAAALVATIDYHNEVKQDVRVKTIKEVK